MLKKSKTPYVRDVYLAYLTQGAKRTKKDNYPIIEEWMVAKEPPKEIVQWDRRKDVVDSKTTGMSFYCVDYMFTPILGNPKRYLDKLRQYQCVIGLDASPYDNMPLWVQKSQIGLNISITYYYGVRGIKVIPNVRLGDDRTISSLDAYPKNTLIAIGTNGFVKTKKNREIFARQVKVIVEKLKPIGICVYGPAEDSIFNYAREKGVKIYQYDSYTMKENKKDKMRLASKEESYERE